MEFNVSVYLCFVLWIIFEEMCLPKHLIHLERRLYESPTPYVWTTESQHHSIYRLEVNEEAHRGI